MRAGLFSDVRRGGRRQAMMGLDWRDAECDSGAYLGVDDNCPIGKFPAILVGTYQFSFH